jgi:LuxR family maltose regulon positive regulatory protein
MSTNPAFGQWLRRLRAERDLTQERLADLAGCVAGMIRSIESGRRRPSALLARRLADSLQLPPAEREQFLRDARGVQPELTAEAVQPAAPAAPPGASPDGHILATKLFAPPPPPYTLARAHLLERLNRDAARLTLAIAPPGFGKSTLLSAWLAELQRPDDLASHTAGATSSEPRPTPQAPLAAWLSLDEQDDDPARFLTYLVAALQQVAPGRESRAAALLNNSQTPPQAVVAALINDLHADPRSLVLVLDDYHMISSAAVHDLLVILVERAPARLRLVIAARSDPPLPLARWRARGLLRELRGADLRFNLAEVTELLVERLNLPLTQAQVAALDARTEGWPAGLQLAGLSLQGHDDVAAFIAAFGGSHRFVFDYLAGEALARLPAHLRSFLLKTSVLRRMSAPLCDAVLGLVTTPDDAGYSGLLLHELEQRNLFLIALDDQRRWWRYHHLFGDVLLTQLLAGASTAEVAALHHRAARWYAEAGEDDEALHHAQLAGDAELTGALLARTTPQLYRQGALTTLLRRMRAVAPAALAARPALAAYAVLALVETGATDEAERLAEVAAPFVPATDPVARAYLLGAQAQLALAREAYERGIAYAHEALDLLGSGDPLFRYELLIISAGAYESANNLAAGLEAGQAALVLSRQLGQSTAVADLMVTNVLAAQGRTAEADAHLQAALAASTDARGELLPNAASLLVIAGRIRFEQGRVTESHALLERARGLVEAYDLTYQAVYVAITLSFTRRCTGDLDGAEEEAGRLRRLAEQLGSAFFLRVADGVDAELALAGDGVEAAVCWAERALGELRATPALMERELEYTLSCFYVLTSIGRAAELLPLVVPLRARLRDVGRWRTVVFVELYEALCLHGVGRSEEAREVLAAAVRQAAALQVMSVFLAVPDLIAELLPLVRSEAPAFVDRVLEAIGQHVTFTAPHAPVATGPRVAGRSNTQTHQRLAEALSERELEVLRLLGSGRSNQAIADELFLAVGTVKRHLNSIFGKLGVASRTEAVARAHTLGLLADT